MTQNNDKVTRYRKSFKRLNKAIEKRKHNQALRIWVEKTPEVHVLNYIYWRVKDRNKIKKIEMELK